MNPVKNAKKLLSRKFQLTEAEAVHQGAITITNIHVPGPGAPNFLQHQKAQKARWVQTDQQSISNSTVTFRWVFEAEHQQSNSEFSYIIGQLHLADVVEDPIQPIGNAHPYRGSWNLF